MNKRFYRDFSGDAGTIIRDRLRDDENVYEYGLDDSKTLCDLLNKEHELLLEKSQTIKELLVENSLLSENLEDTILENESLKIRLEKFKREFREHGILTEQEFLQLITY